MPYESSDNPSNPITGAKAGIFVLPFSMEDQFSTDYSETVGPILIKKTDLKFAFLFVD